MKAQSVRAVYEPYRRGRVALYRGPLVVRAKGSPEAVDGALELALSPLAAVTAYLSDPGGALAFAPLEKEAVVPRGVGLTPPHESELAEIRSKAPVVHRDAVVRVPGLSAVRELVLHITGCLDPPAREWDIGNGYQRQIPIETAAFSITLAPLAPQPEGSGFAAIARAVPREVPIERTEVQDLRSFLQSLLSFMASRSIGIGPIAGLDRNGLPVWADWESPAFSVGAPEHGWLGNEGSGESVTRLATGLERLYSSGGRVVFERALDYHLAANSGVSKALRLDAALSGLCLLEGWILSQPGNSTDESSKRPGSARCQRLLRFAGIPTEVPSSMTALLAFAQRLARLEGDNDEHDGPSTLFAVRKAVSAFDRGSELQVPAPDEAELTEAWVLAAWQLELALMKLLGYEGSYLCRLPGKGRHEISVPWAGSRASVT